MSELIILMQSSKGGSFDRDDINKLKRTIFEDEIKCYSVDPFNLKETRYQILLRDISGLKQAATDAVEEAQAMVTSGKLRMDKF